ncbi:hypothetical protein ACFLTE_03155 [Bacteroidota bacterium]
MKNYNKQLYLLVLCLLCLQPLFSKENSNSDSTKNHKISAIIFPTRNPLNGWAIQFGGIDLFKTNPQDTLLRSSDLFAFLFFSQYKQYNIFLGCDLFLPNEKYYMRGETSFSYFPESYFSLFSDNDPDSSELIDYKINHIYVNTLRKIRNNLFAGISFNYNRTYDFHFSDDGYFIQDHYAEYEGENIIGVGALIKYDSRDNLIWANHGKLFETSYQTFRKNEDGISTFTKYFIDYRQFFELNPRLYHVLGFQVYYEHASENTSFRYLPHNHLRSFHPNLFKNYNSFIARAEFRFKVYRAIYLASFGGTALTFSDFSAIKDEKLRLCIGPGLRLKLRKDEPLFLGVDYGISKVSRNLYVTLSSLF